MVLSQFLSYSHRSGVVFTQSHTWNLTIRLLEHGEQCVEGDASRKAVIGHYYLHHSKGDEQEEVQGDSSGQTHFLHCIMMLPKYLVHSCSGH